MATAPVRQHRVRPWRPSAGAVRRACAIAFAGWTLMFAGWLVVRGSLQTVECTYGRAASCSEDFGSGVVMAVAGYLMTLVAAAGTYRISRSSVSVARGAAAYALSGAVGLSAIVAGNLLGVHTSVGVFATVATFAVVLLPPLTPKWLGGAILGDLRGRCLRQRHSPCRRSCCGSAGAWLADRRTSRSRSRGQHRLTGCVLGVVGPAIEPALGGRSWKDRAVIHGEPRRLANAASRQGGRWRKKDCSQGQLCWFKRTTATAGAVVVLCIVLWATLVGVHTDKGLPCGSYVRPQNIYLSSQDGHGPYEGECNKEKQKERGLPALLVVAVTLVAGRAGINHHESRSDRRRPRGPQDYGLRREPCHRPGVLGQGTFGVVPTIGRCSAGERQPRVPTRLAPPAHTASRAASSWREAPGTKLVRTPRRTYSSHLNHAPPDEEIGAALLSVLDQFGKQPQASSDKPLLKLVGVSSKTRTDQAIRCSDHHEAYA